MSDKIKKGQTSEKLEQDPQKTASGENQSTETKHKNEGSENPDLVDINEKNTPPEDPGDINQADETTSFEAHLKVLQEGGKIRKLEWPDKSAYLKLSREGKNMMYHGDIVIGEYNEFNQSDRDSEWELAK
jgi:hypothetical protein